MDARKSPVCANSLATVDSWGEEMGHEGRIGASRSWGLEREGLGEVTWGQGRGLDRMTSGWGESFEHPPPRPTTFLLPLR